MFESIYHRKTCPCFYYLTPYCNSILYGCPENEIKKLQAIQNSAARLIKVKKKSDEITPILYDLHWLPIKERIVFKLLMFVYKILNNQAPMYLTLLIDLYVPGRTGLRSANPDLLLLQRKDTNVTNKTYGWRAFNICAPLLWNKLPLEIRKSKSLDIFKRNLKTHLFKKRFT